jgi:hypothetical protein
MNDCWAACLGDCSDKISREHIISASLFPADRIMVEGLPWCKGEAKEIGLAALTRKILCTKHNSDLSEADSAASDSMNVLREATRLTNRRIELKIKRPTVRRFQIDGPALERWFLKTFINIAYQQAFPIGSKSARQWVPSADLVEVAFNRREFEPKAGLYFIGEPGEQINSSDRIRAITYTNESDRLVGALFYFRGYRFLLYIDRAGPGEQLHLIGPTPPTPSRPMYHLRKIRTMISRHLSHVVEFRW